MVIQGLHKGGLRRKMAAQDWEVRRMTRDDIAGATALTRRVGWSHDADEWRRLLEWEPEGCYCVAGEVKGEPALIGTVTTTAYGDALAWVGMMLVDPQYRRQGIATALLSTCLRALYARGIARVMLDATDAGLPLYRAFGFRELYRVHMWRGRATEFFGPRARRLRAADMGAVIAYDEQRFGAPRGRVLLRLQAEYPRWSWVDRDARGRVQGYLLARSRGDEVIIGPWLHDSPWGAKVLLHTALGAVRGRMTHVHLPDRNLAATPLAQDYSLQLVGHTTRMIWREVDPLPDQPAAIFAIASPATG
ncbi:MAG: GNAT family N-acetyltransferase [Anaerolineae bacterium]